jgi:hypothetical protein
MAFILNNNAVVAGAMRGILAARSTVSAVAADYNVAAAAAKALADAVNTAVLADVGVKEADLVQGITAGVVYGRYIVSPTSTDYATMAGAIKAAYTASVGKLL